MARLVRRDKKGKVIEVLETDRDRKRKKRERREEPKRERKVTRLAPIEAKRKESGIQRFAKTKVGKVLTSPKTTAVLATTLAGGVGLAAKAGAAGLAAGRSAVITRTAFQGKRSLFRQKTFVGRSSKSGIDKIFHKVRPVAARFPTNTKSQALTSSFLVKAGMALGAAAIVGTTVGTYPFARFELAEATDKLGIAIFRASGIGDKEEVARLVQLLEDMLDESVWENIVAKIPYANVLQSVNKNIDAARESARSILNTVEKQFAETIDFTESREQARQTQLEQRARDAEYFDLIREGKFEEANELLQSELKGGESNE